MAKADEILDFWIDEVGPEGWYKQDDAVDAAIRERFMTDWEAARDGKLKQWKASSRETLAYLVVTDQFGRNIFRDDARAFLLDTKALAMAKVAIAKEWDVSVDEPQRQFHYLPLMHSENLCDQERCVRLMKTRMPQTGAQNLLHARAHRHVIRHFGRFPHRNAALGRNTTRPEQEFLDAGGYGTALRQLEAA